MAKLIVQEWLGICHIAPTTSRVIGILPSSKLQIWWFLCPRRRHDRSLYLCACVRDNNKFILILRQNWGMIGSYTDSKPGNKKSIWNVASNRNCPTIEWMSKKPTAEWNSREQGQRHILDNLKKCKIPHARQQRRASVAATSDFCQKYSSCHQQWNSSECR